MNELAKMLQKPVVLASDHAGYKLKTVLIHALELMGHTVLDLGCETTENSCDYPLYGYKAAEAISSAKAAMGIVICGSGIGISIAANRNPNVRAALCTSAEMAELARKHNNANVLALGARIISEEVASACMNTFLTTEFEGGRHLARVAQLSDMSNYSTLLDPKEKP